MPNVCSYVCVETGQQKPISWPRIYLLLSNSFFFFMFNKGSFFFMFNRGSFFFIAFFQIKFWCLWFFYNLFNSLTTPPVGSCRPYSGTVWSINFWNIGKRLSKKKKKLAFNNSCSALCIRTDVGCTVINSWTLIYCSKSNVRISIEMFRKTSEHTKTVRKIMSKHCYGVRTFWIEQIAVPKKQKHFLRT